MSPCHPVPLTPGVVDAGELVAGVVQSGGAAKKVG